MHASEFARRMARLQAIAVLSVDRSQHRVRRAMAALVQRTDAALICPRGHAISYRRPDGSVARLKHRYRRLDEAKAELHPIARHALHRHIPVCAYACQWCSSWQFASRAR